MYQLKIIVSCGCGDRPLTAGVYKDSDSILSPFLETCPKCNQKNKAKKEEKVTVN